MTNAILYRMPNGVQGDLSRPSQATVEAVALASGTPFTAYGTPGKISGNNFVPLTLVGDTTPYGFLVRPFPTTGVNANDALGVGVPATPAIMGPGNVMRRGYMIVACNAGVPAFGGTVYYRYANPTGPLPLNGLEATSVGGSNVALLGVQWMGLIDVAAPGLAEISFNI
jgi:hypothetical protein